jgi:hypothetical protein
MRWLFQSVVVCLLLLGPVGCNNRQEDEPVWENVKITDLEPPRNGGGAKALRTIHLNVDVFETPAEDIDSMDDVWAMLRRQPVRFSDYEAFEANLFAVGLGQGPMLNRVVELLDAAGAKRAQRMSLLLADGQPNELPMTRLPVQRTIFYASQGSSTDGVDVGPGSLGLRLRADKVPGIRGLCNVRIMPVFVPAFSSALPPLANRKGPRQFRFSSAGFWLRMSVGDFFVLGSRQYGAGQIRLADYLFSQPAPSRTVRLFSGGSSRLDERSVPYFGPVVRTYIVVCTGVNY